ncbi:ATP-binding protein [bacterium]|nr:ATP-binding protein [bacterium]
MKYNPFNPNSVVSTNLFAGRTEYILKIIRKFEQVKRGMPASFFLYGERGIGKTALAKLLKHISEAKNKTFGDLNFLTSYYTAEAGQSIYSVMQACINDLTDKMPKSIVESLSSKLGNLFKNGKFTIGAFSVELAAEKDNSIIIRDQLISIISNILTSLRNPPEKNEKMDGILIIIDEFNNIGDIEKCAQMLRGIITALDVKELGYISFVLIGYDDTVNMFFAGDASARRSIDLIKLDVMPTEETKEVFVKGFDEANIKWEDKDLDDNILATGGYPHSIQLLGHNLLQVDKDDYIDKDDWHQATGITALDLRSKDFAPMYNFEGRSGGREKILDVLAVVNRSLSKKELNDLCSVSNTYQYLPELRKRGSIKFSRDDEKISLHSQLFRTSILIKIAPRILKEGYLNKLLLEEEK